MEALKMDNKQIKSYKKIGKIFDFDGETGTIISNDGTYYFSLKDLNDFTVYKGTEVTFIPNKVTIANETYNMARFIEGYYNNKYNNNNKEESKTI